MATVNGVRLHYVIAGSGPAVVFTHGFPSTSYEWRHVMQRLAGCYTVIAVDLRGMGDSERPLTGYDAFTMAEDVYALMHSLSHDSAFVVGHDIGAPVAYAYAAQHPEAVKKLVTVELVLAGAGLEELIRDHGQQLWHFQFQAVPNLPEALVVGRERTYLEELFRPYTYNPAAITDAAIDEYVRAYSQPGAMRAGFDYYRQIPVTAAKVKAQLAAHGKLTLPVLALAADHSMVRSKQPTPRRRAATTIARCTRTVMSRPTANGFSAIAATIICGCRMKSCPADRCRSATRSVPRKTERGKIS